MEVVNMRIQNKLSLPSHKCFRLHKSQFCLLSLLEMRGCDDIPRALVYSMELHLSAIRTNQNYKLNRSTKINLLHISSRSDDNFIMTDLGLLVRNGWQCGDVDALQL